ncbi:hypothetical protein IAR50_002366 [Cryptococcus sp. DSM 104548]
MLRLVPFWTRNALRDELPTQFRTPTKLGIERKLHISLRDLLVLYYVFQSGGINITVKDCNVSVNVNLDCKVTISAATKYILAQVAQEFHVNKAEFVMLATHDVHMLFQLVESNKIHCSKPLFRDQKCTETSCEMNVVVANALRYRRSPYSLLEVLVAWLIVPVSSGMSGKWAKLPDFSGRQAQENLPSAGDDPTAGGPSGPEASASTNKRSQENPSASKPADGSQRDNLTTGFKLSIESSRYDHLVETNYACVLKHQLPISKLPNFSWHFHPTFKPVPSTPSLRGSAIAYR